MSHVEGTILIDKMEPSQVYAMAKDMESFPACMPDMGGVVPTEWVINIGGRSITWTAEVCFNDTHQAIEYKFIDGDIDKFEGAWRFEPVAEGTKVTLGVDFDYGMFALSESIRPQLETKVQENLQAMKKWIEGDNSIQSPRSVLDVRQEGG